jgi:hypothetical protein
MEAGRMNSPLGNRLLARMKAGETLSVRHATADDLLGFAAERWDCHNNVKRWCKEHPGDHRAMGWIISGGCVLDRHSVVDCGPKGLIDITPVLDRQDTLFLLHEGRPEEFDTLPNQVIVSDTDYVKPSDLSVFLEDPGESEESENY